MVEHFIGKISTQVLTDLNRGRDTWEVPYEAVIYVKEGPEACGQVLGIVPGLSPDMRMRTMSVYAGRKFVSKPSEHGYKDIFEIVE
ncbi:MAG: hypothetical protein HYW26_02775 [Candidatus Aenigmarchaeota archaeon]|nr:hypothetical protein [Candidatus Aenigmarchaeota archaeon]